MSLTDFGGRWRIVEMDAWDIEDLGLLGPAYIDFSKDKTGEFQFVAIVGYTDCRYSERAGLPFVEFTWNGNDESDHTSGRGWAVLEMNGALKGHVYIHDGDDSGFVAARDRKNATKPAPVKRKR